MVVDRAQQPAAVAVIARRNRAGRVEWCLPKGHVEGAETLEQTAVREVAEGLGVSTKSIYTWQKQFSRSAKVIQEVDAPS